MCTRASADPHGFSIHRPSAMANLLWIGTGHRPDGLNLQVLLRHCSQGCCHYRTLQIWHVNLTSAFTCLLDVLVVSAVLGCL